MRKINYISLQLPVLPLGFSLLFCLLISLVLLSAAPCLAQESANDIIERAMKDELERSMKELSYEDYEKPFFISYMINDGQHMSANASLGAVIQSYRYPLRSHYVRVMVGDYDFNDESMDESSYYPYYPLAEISMPKENDYFGIRRALWASTDIVYKSAARAFADHKQYVKEQQVPLQELPHRRFVKTPVVELISDSAAAAVPLEELEALVRELSAVFKGEEMIHSSMVSVDVYNITNHFLNSEGSKVRKSKSYTSFHAFAEIKTAAGESVYEQIRHQASVYEKLPSKEALKNELEEMKARLKKLPESPVFEESYYGPVLFVEEAAGAVFSYGLFRQESLVASHAIPNRNSYAYGRSRMEDKIGSRVLDAKLSVKSLPRLKTFQGEELLGSFEVDEEGVVPPDELVLVEDGQLLRLLNDRTAIAQQHEQHEQQQHEPNGHSSSYHAAGPGVIQVSAKNAQSHEALKAQLIALAEEEGLAYALMIKRIPLEGYIGLDVYKVSLEDGSETLFRSASMESPSLKSLRKIAGVSDQSFVYHVSMGRGGNSSFIVPNGLLLKEVEVEGRRGPYLGKEMLVENPVKRQD